MIPAVWHGIDENAEVDKVWIPDHDCCRRTFAQSADEIVIDQHAVEALELKLGDTIRISAGQVAKTTPLLGFAFHSNHLFLAPLKMTLFQPNRGTFVTGYLTAEGLEKLGLTSVLQSSSNRLMIDVVGYSRFLIT